MNEQELFEKTKVSKAVAKMAVPTVAASLVTILYNLADTFFVGQTNDALQVAAVGLTNPIFILLMAIGHIFGMGGSAMVSISLGQKDAEKVKRISSFVTYGGFFAGILVTIILIMFMQPILYVFGADASTYEFARGYTQYIAWGAPFIVWGTVSTYIVRAEGQAKLAMAGGIAGTASNIILDPILITGMGLGVRGAALATTVANIIQCAFFLYYFLKRTRNLSVNIRDFSLRGRLPWETCKIGLPSALTTALMSVSVIILNQLLKDYGQEAVAANGIVFKASMFINFCQSGIANGVQPILGYNYGAQNHKRFDDVERFSRKVVLVIGIGTTALYLIFRNQIMQAFLNDDAVISVGVPMFVAYIISGPALGMIFMNMNCLQSTKYAREAIILSILRQGFIFIPLAFVLDSLFKIDGLMFGQSITDYIVFIVSSIVWFTVKKKLRDSEHISL